MARCRFTNPSTAAYYEWYRNYSEEEPTPRTRNIEHTAPTANDAGLVKQQGDDQAFVKKVKGTIVTLAQHEQFIYWDNLCGTQTIYFSDSKGWEYEVSIIDYSPQEVRVARNEKDPVNLPLTIIKYDLAMEVIAFRSGPWVGTNP